MNFPTIFLDWHNKTKLVPASFSCFELWVTVYCTSCELLFAYELRVTFYIRVMSYHLLHDLRVNFYVQVTSCYSLQLFILRVGIDCVKFLYYMSYSIFMTCSLQNQLFLVSYSCAMHFMNMCFNVKVQSILLWSIPYNIKYYWAINFHECFLQRWIILEKTIAQQLKNWLLNATRVLVVQ